MRRSLALAALALVLSFASRASAQEVVAAPPTYAAEASPAPPRTVHHMDHGFVEAGTTLFLVMWTINIPSSLLARTLGSPDGDTALNYDMLSLIPLVGPLAQMGFASGIEWTIPILAAAEAIEIAGLVMMIVGAIGVDDEASELGGLRLLPMASASMGGAQLAGSF